MNPAEPRSPLIIPVILSGGAGTRLWPLSRPERPKQFLPLTSTASMIQLTAQRTGGREGFAPPFVVANAAHADLIDTQLEEVGIRDARLILEPVGRNTAPAIALAALAAESADAPLLVMPSDHVIADVEAFHAAIARALPLVRQGWLVTFGITPDQPETGYGYIRLGSRLAEGAYRVDHFVEKPDIISAQAMLDEGSHVWNAGIFLFRADAYLAALEHHQPAMMAAIGKAMDAAGRGSRIVPNADHFSQCPSDSIDYAVMEKADQVAVLPVSMGWSDIGSWDALHAINACDEDGNACTGDVMAIETRNCLIHSDGPRVALVGVEDLIVVASGKDILILPRGRSQDVRKVTEALGSKA